MPTSNWIGEEACVDKVIRFIDQKRITSEQYGAVLIDESNEFKPEWFKLVVQTFEHESLLNQWTDVYVRVLRPRTVIGRYYVAGFEGWKNWPIAEYGALWGGANLLPRC